MVRYKHLGDHLYIVETPGDGNCMYHSVLGATDKEYLNSEDSDFKRDRSTELKNEVRNKAFQVHPDYEPFTYWEVAGRGDLFNMFLEVCGMDYDPTTGLDLLDRGFCDQPLYMFHLLSLILELNIFVFTKFPTSEYGVQRFQSTKFTRNSIMIFADQYAEKNVGDEVTRYMHYSTLAYKEGNTYDTIVRVELEDLDLEEYSATNNYTHIVRNPDYIQFIREYSTPYAEVRSMLSKYL